MNFNPEIESVITGDQHFKIADLSDEKHLHDILESETMKIGNFAEVNYSRRPSIQKSYDESGFRPSFFLSKSLDIFGAISTLDVHLNGVKNEIYYTSDLRICKTAKAKTRIRFRQLYKEVIKTMSKDCYTIILKENMNAITALTSGKAGFFYHKVGEYTAQSVLISPSLKLIKPNQAFVFEPIKEQDAFTFIKEKLKQVEFGQYYKSKNFYKVSLGNTILGVFSFDRPQNRTITIVPLLRVTKVALKISKLLFKKDYQKKMPWIYITNYFCSDKIDFRDIIAFLYNKKLVRNGELLLRCHTQDKSELLPTYCSNTQGILFKVSSDEKAPSPFKSINLNPINI